MTDTPEIPDSVSPEMLDNLLRNCNPLPTSELIPALDLGGESGGPCDLQFAICQIIERSKLGASLLQRLVASMYLLAQIEDSFSARLEDLMLEHPPYDEMTGHEQQIAGNFLRSHLIALRVSLQQMEQLLAEISMPYYDMRAKTLIQEVFKGHPRSLRDFRSHMLISSELLDSLQIERDAVTTYLDQIQPQTP